MSDEEKRKGQKPVLTLIEALTVLEVRMSHSCRLTLPEPILIPSSGRCGCLTPRKRFLVKDVAGNAHRQSVRVFPS